MNTPITLSIPTEWSEVSMKQYSDYIASVSDEDTNEDNLAKILLHFCNVKPNLVKHFKITDLQRIQTSLEGLMIKPINKTIINKINIDGKLFGFHPKLDELTMGEFVDLDTHSKANNLSKMMAILYRPILEEDGVRYTIEPYSFSIHGKNHKLLESLSINIANAVAVFFWTLGEELLKDTRTYLEERKKVEQKLVTVGSPS